MTERNENKVTTSPSVRLEQFLIETDIEHQVVYNGHPADGLLKPTEGVVGKYGARGSIVWVALAEEDDVVKNGCAIHQVVVDSTEFKDVEAMTAAIEQLTIVRDQLVRLQQA